MAAGTNFKFTTTAGEVIDLTSATVNPNAAPTATPRQGGFVLRNRWNCDNLSAANKQTFGPFSASVTASATSANIIKVLKVPKRTLVVGPVQVMAVASQTIPGHAVLGAATKADLNSAGAAGVLGFTGYAYNDNSQTAASIKLHTGTTIDGATVLAGCALGGIAIQKFDSHNGAFEASQVEAVDTSMTAPWLGRVTAGQKKVGSTVYPDTREMYFPYGGFVVLNIGPTNTALGAMASSKGAASAKGLYGYMTGTWEVQARAMYIPE